MQDYCPFSLGDLSLFLAPMSVKRWVVSQCFSGFYPGELLVLNLGVKSLRMQFLSLLREQNVAPVDYLHCGIKTRVFKVVCHSDLELGYQI